MSQHKFAVCINNDSCNALLEVRKQYEFLPDHDAAKHGQVRVIDQSDDDYLYPKSLFAAVELPPQTQLLVLRAS